MANSELGDGKIGVGKGPTKANGLNLGVRRAREAKIAIFWGWEANG